MAPPRHAVPPGARPPPHPGHGRLPAGGNSAWEMRPAPRGWARAREGGGCQMCVWQEPVAFEDVAVYLSRTEWDTITAEQRELYCSVMRDNYRLLTSLGYPGPKPDILYRMERGEEPWVCSPQSPARWEGPSCPSPGCDGAMSLLEVPPWGWWPGAGVPEERAQSPCQAGGQCLQRRLQSERLLHKLRYLKGRSKVPVKAASRGVVPAESQNHTQTVVWPRKEEAAEDKRWVTADVAQGRELALNPRTEQQNYKSDPQEHPCGDQKEQCQRSTYENGCTSEVPFFLGNGELRAQDANEAVWKDHCYCGAERDAALAPRPLAVSPTDHNYCRPQALGSAVLKEHGYCRCRGLVSGPGL
ncbi:zinc finger protein 74-like isoform X3 [Strigops habroptila]|uniref:zinc finger protein 74-like isoform X3 n=1 Tax=Strigops habroptila TaxID=2489341 RepID=UPI0011CF69C2|nr:zinc finger protein 74-like isoform X3 [Strigops habroptila]